jgi:hypothetical protein
MADDIKDRTVNTDQNKDRNGHLPHERDEQPDLPDRAPRQVIKQAASDLEQGLVDTDLHGERGVEKVQPKAPQESKPDPTGHTKPAQ